MLVWQQRALGICNRLRFLPSLRSLATSRPTQLYESYDDAVKPELRAALQAVVQAQQQRYPTPGGTLNPEPLGGPAPGGDGSGSPPTQPQTCSPAAADGPQLSADAGAGAASDAGPPATAPAAGPPTPPVDPHSCALAALDVLKNQEGPLAAALPESNIVLLTHPLTGNKIVVLNASLIDSTPSGRQCAGVMRAVRPGLLALHSIKDFETSVVGEVDVREQERPPHVDPAHWEWAQYLYRRKAELLYRRKVLSKHRGKFGHPYILHLKIKALQEVTERELAHPQMQDDVVNLDTGRVNITHSLRVKGEFDELKYKEYTGDASNREEEWEHYRKWRRYLLQQLPFILTGEGEEFEELGEYRVALRDAQPYTRILHIGPSTAQSMRFLERHGLSRSYRALGERDSADLIARTSQLLDRHFSVQRAQRAQHTASQLRQLILEQEQRREELVRRLQQGRGPAPAEQVAVGDPPGRHDGAGAQQAQREQLEEQLAAVEQDLQLGRQALRETEEVAQQALQEGAQGGSHEEVQGSRGEGERAEDSVIPHLLLHQLQRQRPKVMGGGGGAEQGGGEVQGLLRLPAGLDTSLLPRDRLLYWLSREARMQAIRDINPPFHKLLCWQATYMAEQLAQEPPPPNRLSVAVIHADSVLEVAKSWLALHEGWREQGGVGAAAGRAAAGGGSRGRGAGAGEQLASKSRQQLGRSKRRKKGR